MEWQVRPTTIPFNPLCDQGLRKYSYLHSGSRDIKCQETTQVYSVQLTL